MRTKKKRLFKALVLVALITLLAVNSKTITSVTRTSLTDLASLPLNALHSISGFFKKLPPFASIAEENRLLRARIDILLRRLEEMNGLHEENQRLKDLIAFKKFVPFTTVPAEVIGRDPTNWSNSLIIDKGMASGVRQNKAVIATRGLAGRVLEVGRHSARVLLITDPNSKVGVLIQRNRQGGILVGMPDGTCKMIYIALDADVVKGDRVITAGFGTVFPKDILVGTVVKVGKEPGRLYKYAIVEPSQDMSKLGEVLCIK